MTDGSGLGERNIKAAGVHHYGPKTFLWISQVAVLLSRFALRLKKLQRSIPWRHASFVSSKVPLSIEHSLRI